MSLKLCPLRLAHLWKEEKPPVTYLKLSRGWQSELFTTSLKEDKNKLCFVVEQKRVWVKPLNTLNQKKNFFAKKKIYTTEILGEGVIIPY